MTPERWGEVEGVLRSALEHAPGERAAFLDQACGADADLRREVESLLAADQGATSFLEPPAVATPQRADVDLTGRLAAALAGRYTLDRELGRGGMATVYLARDLKHDRPVALKVMHPDLGLGAGTERFLREIRTTARLDHPHILAVHDSGEAQGLLWYTMPYVEGESLRQRLERAGPLPVAEAVRLAGEAADALECAHRRGVVHRDIKPENILLAGGHARVADFGIATALEAAAGGGERLTATGVSVGTPAYMSPEQAGGARVLDGRSDIYSLGCVLYELLAGQPPFTGPTPQAVIARRFVESPPPLTHVRQAVSPAVEAAVDRALAREPADRFQTATDFRDALAQAPAGAAAAVPASVPGPHVPTRAPVAGRPKGSRRLPAGFVLLALAVLLGLGVLFAWRRAAGGSGEGAAGPQLLAVLPFETLGDSADAYLADGVSDAVRGKLAALPGLRVIAGASSRAYRGTTKPLPQVARELGVRYLVVGRVRREGGESREQGRVRVSPELLEVGRRGSPTTRWEEPLEAPLADVFQVEADVARGVAAALGVVLRPEERLRLAEPPTRNLAAYQAFLRGERISKGLEENAPAILRQVLPYYEQAVALDSSFVEAWARLSETHSELSFSTPRAADVAAARAAADRAVTLGPDRPDGYLALGRYYSMTGDNPKALEQATLGLRVAPHHAELLSMAGLIEQFLGRWDAALGHFRQAYALDPRSTDAARTLAYALFLLRRYPEALAATDRALALEPSSVLFQLKAMIHLGRGDLPGARSIVQGALKQVEPASLVAYFGYYWDLFWVLEKPEQELLLRLPPDAYDNNRAIWGLVLAQTYALRGEQARSRAYADSARLAFEDQLPSAEGDAQLHALYGLALAYLGRKAEAVREGERGVALMPIASHSLLGPYIQHLLARTYLLVGEPERALDRLEPLLRIPYYLSPGWLKIDPTFDQLRGDPRFQRLLDGTV